MHDDRPDWDTYFLGIAHAVAERTDCRRAKCGAVLVDTHHRIVGSGYPGTVAGRRGCLQGACPRGLKDYTETPPLSAYDDCISLHAESNAILHSDRALYTGGTIYVTREPCHWCLKMLQGAGLIRAVWPGKARSRDFTIGDKTVTLIQDVAEEINLRTWRAA